MNVDDFWAQFAGQPYQLIHGQPILNVQKGYLHEVVTSRIIMSLEVYVEEYYLGSVFGGGARFALADQEVRATDISFVSEAKLNQIRDPELYLPFAPDLMVEVVSSRFTSTQIQQKANLFIDAGTPLVWIVDPDPKEVTLLFADGSGMTLAGHERLSGYDVIPGLSMSVDDLFPPLNTQLRLY